MRFGHQASENIQEQWIYFPDQSLMYEGLRKEKIDLALKFVKFTKSQKRSQIKPRNHEEAKIQRLRNTTQTYYCDVSWWRRFGTEPQTSFPTSFEVASLLDFSRLKRAQANQERTEQPTT